MSYPMSAPEILDREFLQIRAKILELGAALDRLDRGDESVETDPRMRLIAEALQRLQGSDTDRAEQIQMIFSRQYDDHWQSTYGLAPRFTPK